MIMTISLLETYILFLFIFVFVFFFLYKKPQGSPLLKDWPFLGMLPGVVFQIPRIYDFTAELLEPSDLTFAFKGVWFSGTDLLLTADSKNIHHILSSNFQNYRRGPEFKKILDMLGDGIVPADSELWGDLRKSNHSIFHNQDFIQHSKTTNISKLEKGLIPYLDNAAEQSIIIDLQDVLQRFMFDTSSILLTGFDPMTLSIKMPEVNFGEAVEICEEAIIHRHYIPVILWKLQDWIGIGLERKMRTSLVTVNQMFAEIISSRRERIRRGEREPQMDVLTFYMNVDTTKYKHLKPKNDKFIRDVIFNILVAARDTTSSALTWFFWLLSKHPQVLAKIRNEIQPNFDSGDLENLVYFHAALLESLRLYPPIPLNHKSPAKSDVLPSGHKVEADSKIILCMYALGRMRPVWGEDAAEFKPERWISDKGEIRHEPSHKFVAFGAGPRTCLGKHLAIFQMKILAANIIRNYDFKIIKDHKIEPVPSVVLRMKHGLKVTVSKKI